MSKGGQAPDLKKWLREEDKRKSGPPFVYKPPLTRFMDKKVRFKLNANRTVMGVLRGFDQFMNIVLDNSVELTKGGEENEIGMVVIRGNSVVMIEALEHIETKEVPGNR